MRLVTAALFVASAALAACRSEKAPVAAPEPVVQAPAPAPLVVERDEHGVPNGLENFLQWTPKVSGGAQPEGDIAFQNLAAMDIHTILTVDGAKPDIETAGKYGIRYIHVPIGYDGVSVEQAQMIDKAVATTDGQIYIHCHHGKHRSAAALAVSCVALEGLSNQQVLANMKLSGTDPKYAGLWKAAQDARPVDAAAARTYPGELKSYCPPDDLALVMVDVDQRWDNLKASRKVGWGLLKDHDDVSPPHEALIVREHFRELARLGDGRIKEAAFAKFLAETETTVANLETAIRANDKAAADKHFDAATKLCSSCHAQYRDK